jgi:hypothetical protein
MAGRLHGDQARRLEYHHFSRMAAVRILKRRYSGKISKIKQQQGPNLHVYGSANLVQTLRKHDLVDALWLKIFPITFGWWKTVVCRWHDPGGVQDDGKQNHLEWRHYRELRACRRNHNRKFMNPEWGTHF